MKTLFFRCCSTYLIAIFTLMVAPQAAAQVKPLLNNQVELHEHSSAVIQSASSDSLKVVLLGTGMGPRVNLQQFGASTLIEAGSARLLFDCGRGVPLEVWGPEGTRDMMAHVQ
ncbi:MAG: hypothetical protein ACREVV_21155 [Steroidobacteraceae bacterium]